MNDEERFLFDNRGYIVVRDALTQDQVETLKSSHGAPTEQFSGEDPTATLHWHSVWRDLLDLPLLTPYLEAMIGNHELRARREANAANRAVLPTYRLDHINAHTHVEKGFAGGDLHGGKGVTGWYGYHDGRFDNGLLTVSFELYDTWPNDGGFACIPGSHKTNIALPPQWADLSKGVHECVARVAAKPGDAIIFTEALIHGTLPWTADSPRNTVFYKFSPHHSSWGAWFYNPDDYRQYPDMDDRKLALLEPPNARYPGRPTRPERREKRQEKAS